MRLSTISLVMEVILRTESESDVEYDPEQEDTSDEEDSPYHTDAQRELFKSNKGDLSWSSIPNNNHTAPTENIIRMTRGILVQDIQTAFELFIPPSDPV